jgi:hypothetical protein
VALQLSLQDSETGATFTAAYVRIVPGSIKLDFANQHGEFKAYAFVDGQAAAAGKTRVVERTFLLDGPEFQQVFGTSAANRAYAYLKTLPIFNGALDV